jgi:alpha-tubulin suppressor-like RCC1 family protein
MAAVRGFGVGPIRRLLGARSRHRHRLAALAVAVAFFALGLASCDLLTPGPVSSLVALPSSRSVDLSWVNPSSPGLSGVLIRSAVGTVAPATPDDGVLVADVAAPEASVQVADLQPSMTYSLAVFALDATPSYSDPVDLTVTTTPDGVGQVYTWGTNLNGQLGNGQGPSLQNTTTPAPIGLAPGVTPTSISAGVAHALAIGSDHQLYAWGDNSDGELGDGSTTDQGTPEVITLAPGVTPTSISAGGFISFAIGSDHQLYAWGSEAGGGLGDGGNSSIVTRPRVISLAFGETPTTVSAGNRFALVIDADSHVWGWGSNGPLGTYAAEVDSPVPIFVPGAWFSARAISAGWYHSLAIGVDGQLYAWGDNRNNELGIDNPEVPSVAEPMLVRLPAGVTPAAVSAGQLLSMMTDSSGTVYTWGGQGDEYLRRIEPSPLPAGVTATAINAGDAFFMAIGSDGNLYAWSSVVIGARFPDRPTLLPGIHPLAISAKGNGLDEPFEVGGALVGASPFFAAIG